MNAYQFQSLPIAVNLQEEPVDMHHLQEGCFF